MGDLERGPARARVPVTVVDELRTQLVGQGSLTALVGNLCFARWSHEHQEHNSQQSRLPQPSKDSSHRFLPVSVWQPVEAPSLGLPFASLQEPTDLLHQRPGPYPHWPERADTSSAPEATPSRNDALRVPRCRREKSTAMLAPPTEFSAATGGISQTRPPS